MVAMLDNAVVAKNVVKEALRAAARAIGHGTARVTLHPRTGVVQVTVHLTDLSAQHRAAANHAVTTALTNAGLRYGLVEVL